MLVTNIDDQSSVCFQRMRILETALAAVCVMQANGDVDVASQMYSIALREATAFVLGKKDSVDIAASDGSA